VNSSLFGTNIMKYGQYWTMDEAKNQVSLSNILEFVSLSCPFHVGIAHKH
jgi:hypothetical protein